MPIKIRNYFLMAFCGQYPANHFKNPFEDLNVRIYDWLCAAHMDVDMDYDVDQMANSRININSNVHDLSNWRPSVSSPTEWGPNCKQLHNNNNSRRQRLRTRVSTRKGNKKHCRGPRGTCSMKFKQSSPTSTFSLRTCRKWQSFIFNKQLNACNTQRHRAAGGVAPALLACRNPFLITALCVVETPPRLKREQRWRRWRRWRWRLVRDNGHRLGRETVYHAFCVVVNRIVWIMQQVHAAQQRTVGGRRTKRAAVAKWSAP